MNYQQGLYILADLDNKSLIYGDDFPNGKKYSSNLFQLGCGVHSFFTILFHESLGSLSLIIQIINLSNSIIKISTEVELTTIENKGRSWALHYRPGHLDQNGPE